MYTPCSTMRCACTSWVSGCTSEKYTNIIWTTFASRHLQEVRTTNPHTQQQQQLFHFVWLVVIWYCWQEQKTCMRMGMHQAGVIFWDTLLHNMQKFTRSTQHTVLFCCCLAWLTVANIILNQHASGVDDLLTCVLLPQQQTVSLLEWRSCVMLFIIQSVWIYLFFLSRFCESLQVWFLHTY
jgi:hypothetical protein